MENFAALLYTVCLEGKTLEELSPFSSLHLEGNKIFASNDTVFTVLIDAGLLTEVSWSDAPCVCVWTREGELYITDQCFDDDGTAWIDFSQFELAQQTEPYPWMGPELPIYELMCAHEAHSYVESMIMAGALDTRHVDVEQLVKLMADQLYQQLDSILNDDVIREILMDNMPV